MPFLSVDDADFWGRIPNEFRAILDQAGDGEVGVSYFELGRREDNAPAVTCLRMEPGFVLPRHAHDCHRFEIIVKGSLTVEGRVLRPGSVMISEPGVVYGPGVAGPEGCTTFEIFSTHHGSHTALIPTDTGELVEYDVWTPEGARKMAEHARKQAAVLAE
ncbi:cupin domain-containing protein [Rhizorhabdus dicambivorans]|uniref:ChrR-like cupin domain-containing protein n=1 Tax=Rhizorhabdus dicambivorans TaxID=1850238 RepID=A0A2A4FUI4_9SPHN|nr:hypothetical protein [Rhizorhabdus dicambivorans]ATE65809.1 hypothetical protein CMV14_16545 [Rhizorhabdus dicambivorans]PCE41108.1 hypothetical protein COO09_16515 [Rhizorhabdus dicambivorans]